MKRRPVVPVLLLLLTLAAADARAASPFTAIPEGARVRVVSTAHRGTLTGTFVRAGSDSLSVAPAGGIGTVAVPLASVRSFAYVSDVRRSPRKAALLGIGLGAVGGAALSIAAAHAGEGNAGGAGGGGGGDRGPAFAPAGGTAVAATSATTSTGGSNLYRGVMGAVLGGAAGGVLGALTGLGQNEEHWTNVALGPVGAAPPPAAAPVFAVRFAWPRGRPGR